LRTVFAGALRAVFAGALRAVLAGVLEADAEAARFAGALRLDAEAARFAGALRVEPEDFDDAEVVFRVAGFFFAELEREAPLCERLLGFFGVAMARNYSEAHRIERRFSPF
jgi:hypothetical protein